MPFPSDEQLLALSQDLIQQFDTIFGVHPGFRPAHAKGILLQGTFRPAPGASSLTRAPHTQRESTPVTVRFSDSSGFPVIPDGDPNANPKGFALRFHLGEHVHTDIIAHSTDGFPTRTGQEFLEFLRAVAAGHPETFLETHPKALAFAQSPKPTPSSFARENYFGVTALRFTNEAGVSRYGRYRIVPDAGTDYLSVADAAAQSPNFLLEELAPRIARGPVVFQLLVQLANEGDVVDDATIHWPEDRESFHLGTVTLTSLVALDAVEQKQIIFDPIPRVSGIDPSADPLLELRAAVYLMSGRRRRSA